MNFNLSKSNKPPVTKRVEKRRKSAQLSSPPRRHSTAVDQFTTWESHVMTQPDALPKGPTAKKPRLPTRPSTSKDVVVGRKHSKILASCDDKAPKESVSIRLSTAGNTVVRKELIDGHETVSNSLFMTPPPAPMSRSSVPAELVDHKIHIQNSIHADGNEPCKESLFMTPPPCASDTMQIKREPDNDNDSGISSMDEDLPDTPESQEACSPNGLSHDFDQILKKVAGSHMSRTWEIISDTLSAALNVRLTPDEMRRRYFDLMERE